MVTSERKFAYIFYLESVFRAVARIKGCGLGGGSSHDEIDYLRRMSEGRKSNER
jgi:hypothetical protein